MKPDSLQASRDGLGDYQQYTGLLIAGRRVKLVFVS